jgi:hypothetical protein
MAGKWGIVRWFDPAGVEQVGILSIGCARLFTFRPSGAIGGKCQDACAFSKNPKPELDGEEATGYSIPTI